MAQEGAVVLLPTPCSTCGCRSSQMPPLVAPRADAAGGHLAFGAG